MEQTSNILDAFSAATRDPSSPLHFTPVKRRARADGWTAERQRRFVAVLVATGHIGQAVEGVGMSRNSLSKLARRADAASFNRACYAASLLASRRRSAARAEAYLAARKRRRASAWRS